MPTLTTLRIGLPVWPVHSPERTRSAKALMRSSVSCTCLTTSTPSTISERSRGIRSATWSTARSSETLMCSPANIASRRSSTPRSRASCAEQHHRLVGDPVLGEVEVEAGAVGDQALAALGVGGEEVAQVPALDLGEVALERLPGGRLPQFAHCRWSVAPIRDRLTGGRSVTGERSALGLDRLEQVVPGLDEGLLALLLEPLGQRVDVDPGALRTPPAPPRSRRRRPGRGRRPRRGRRRRAGSARASC